MSNPCFYSSSPGTSTSGVVTPSSCRLRRGYCTNGNAAARYLQIFEAQAVPAPGSAPKISIPLDPAVGGTVSREYLASWISDDGLNFTAGLCWAISQTMATYDPTNVVATDHSVVIIGSSQQ